MKYTQKYLNKLYKEPTSNFTEIINISIYFEDIGELDYGCEAVAAIEKLEPIIISDLLIKDLINRKKIDFDNYGYQRLWWAILNSQNNEIYENISLKMTTQLNDIFTYWINEIFDENDEPYLAIKKILISNKILNLKLIN